MSALGHKRTSQHVRVMSALPPKADMDQQGCDVCFVPKADIVRCGENTSLLDHLVGGGEQGLRERQAKRLGGLEVEDKLEFGRLFNR